MRTLELQLPDELASRLERAAADRGISVEEFLRVSIEEKIERDGLFETEASHVLDKNAELYRRLS